MCFSDICQAIIFIFSVAIHLEWFMNKKEKKKKNLNYMYAPFLQWPQGFNSISKAQLILFNKF